jgi:hypothetical protein
VKVADRRGVWLVAESVDVFVEGFDGSLAGSAEADPVPRVDFEGVLEDVRNGRGFMTTGQRAMVAARCGELPDAPPQVDRARLFSVSSATLRQAEAVLRSGDDALIAEVDRRDGLPVYKAYQRLHPYGADDRE